MPAMQTARGRFASELDPGTEAIQTTETVESKDYRGKTIKVPVYQSSTPQTKLVPIVDENGKKVPKTSVSNQPIGGFVTQRVFITDPDDKALAKPESIVGFVEYTLAETTDADGNAIEAIHLIREYIPVDLGNGMVEKNFGFRASKAEGERKEAEKKRARALELIGGLDPAKFNMLVDALAGDE